jgi:riboflavin synthase
MFTGIIEAAGAVEALRAGAGGARLELADVPFAGELAVGESVAVNGCCLTVTAADRDGRAGFDLLGETLAVTNLGRLKPGSLVNLERAMRLGDRLSGHLVQGHVDATSEVIDFSPRGSDHRLELALPDGFGHLVIPRGSIAVDGISLTLAEVNAGTLLCWIIPHTAAVSNLRAIQPGDRVNLEFDMIGKYVARQARPPGGSPA